MVARPRRLTDGVSSVPPARGCSLAAGEPAAGGAGAERRGYGARRVPALAEQAKAAGGQGVRCSEQGRLGLHALQVRQ